jgi:beta-glucanase (GH16 family)
MLRAIVLLALVGIAAAAPPGYELKWADEFDGTKLDLTKWRHWLPGKRRDAINTPDALSVGGGKLTITTYTEGGKHHTGMISTQGIFEPSFGYYEARIEWQDAPGMWSVFWSISEPMMLPHMGEHIGNVATAGNEVDFVEHRETDHEGKRMAGKVNFTLHWDGYAEHRNGSGFLTPDLGLDKGFHIYGCEWSESGYRFFIDGKMLWETPGPISRRPQFIVLCSEVEDMLWSWHIPKEGYGDRASSKVKMVVDYVRYYAKPLPAPVQPAGSR